MKKMRHSVNGQSVYDMDRRSFLKVGLIGSAVTLLGMPLGSRKAYAEIPQFTVAQASGLRTLDPHMHSERVNHIVDDNKCIGCGFCEGACPCGIWEMVTNDPLDV